MDEIKDIFGGLFWAIVILASIIIGIIGCQKCSKMIAIGNGTYEANNHIIDTIQIETRYSKYFKLITDKDCYITENMEMGNELLVQGKINKGKNIKIIYYIQSGEKNILKFTVGE